LTSGLIGFADHCADGPTAFGIMNTRRRCDTKSGTVAVYTTYGTSTHTVNELRQLITERIGVEFTAHDSCYRGVYLLADTPTGRIAIQPNAIPGNDRWRGALRSGTPTFPTLLLLTAPNATLATRLNSIDGLHLLTDRPT
jgi:hypothetical protein